MKFDQILVCGIKNISNIFFSECWRVESSSRLLYDFIKITILQDLAIFNGWYLQILIIPYSPFQKNETCWNHDLIGY